MSKRNRRKKAVVERPAAVTLTPQNPATPKESATKSLRQSLKAMAEMRQKEMTKKLAGISTLSSRQEPEEGRFTNSIVKGNRLITPPYDPIKLYAINESSAILPQCIEAMIANIDGFGYELMYSGPSDSQYSDASQKEKQRLIQFFGQVNESQSFITLRKALRRDIEVTGNAYMEVIRFLDGKLAMLYYMDSRYVRLQAIQRDPVEIEVELLRDGEIKKVKVMKRFRAFAMIQTGNRIKWFKEYGDPRKMDAYTGKYEGDAEGQTKEIRQEASELIHLKIGNDTYGIPRWIGNVLNAMGMHASDFVNWDLFENQVVPPLFILVSGGSLTSESVQDVMDILMQKRGTENFNKVVILESQGEGGVDEKNTAKVDVKEMSMARKEDAMFTNYVEKGEKRVRASFRLPPLYLGMAETYAKATADSAKMVTEEQVFVPERFNFDEIINILLMPALGATVWRYRSKGPRLVTGQDVISAFDTFSKWGVFTINEGIRVANNVLGLDLTVYEGKDKAPWADYPVALVMALANLGQLSGVEEIQSITEPLTDALGSIENDEQAAKMYLALSHLRNTLRKLADQRDEAAKLSDATMGGRIEFRPEEHE